MSRRFGIVLVLFVLAAVAAGILLRPAREAGEEREAPIVAPNRVREEDGEARVVLDSAEVARVGIGLAVLARADRGEELRVAGEVVAEPERTAVIRAPVAGRLTAPESSRERSRTARRYASSTSGPIARPPVRSSYSSCAPADPSRARNPS